MTCDVIATGSTGNAVLLDGRILIDCGVPWGKISHCYRDLQFCLLTHLHSDHFNMATIRRLHVERPSLRFVCGQWIAKMLIQAGFSPLILDVLGDEEAAYYSDGTKIRLFYLQHDIENAGFRVELPNGERAFYATDTGSLSGIPAREYDLYLIEANHNEAEIQKRISDKLAAGEYCYEYRAQYTHLSREKAEKWLAENAKPGISKVVFLHQHVDKEATT